MRDNDVCSAILTHLVRISFKTQQTPRYFGKVVSKEKLFGGDFYVCNIYNISKTILAIFSSGNLHVCNIWALGKKSPQEEQTPEIAMFMITVIVILIGIFIVIIIIIVINIIMIIIT